MYLYILVDSPAGRNQHQEGFWGQVLIINFSSGSLVFHGSAADLEDGDLTANLLWSSNLSWPSNPYGEIGAGGYFSRTDLITGVHTITASVTDSHARLGAVQFAITVTPNAKDTVPPTPDPMTWAVAPVVAGSTSISMTATAGSDSNGVEYYFACTAGGGHDSGWQDTPTYTDTGLQEHTWYTYQVKARDRSAQQNETGWSGPASAVIGGGVVYLPFVSRAPGSGLQNPQGDLGFTNRRH